VSSNYAFKPIAEQARRPNQAIVPQRLNAALDLNDLVPTPYRNFCRNGHLYWRVELRQFDVRDANLLAITET
jgi:hypothetical protein